MSGTQLRAALAALLLVAGSAALVIATTPGRAGPSGTAATRQATTPASTPGAPSGTQPVACGALQARIDATPTGGRLELGRCSFVVARTAVIRRPMTLTGGILRATTSALLITSSSVSVSGMTISGPGPGAVSRHDAIRATGRSAAGSISNVTLSGNVISGWSGDGIFAMFVRSFAFSDNDISDVWYAGIEGWSLVNGRIDRNHVRRVVGTPNAYGIAVTRGYGGGLVTNPRSTDVDVADNTIEDVPNWEGLDTHAGERIRFTGNVIRRVRSPIVVCGSRDASDGPGVYAPLDVTVDGNVIESQVVDGSRDVGVFFTGAGDGAPGSTDLLATGTISNNTIIGYGRQDNGDSTAIQARDTSGLVIARNTIVEASPTAISLYYNNFDFHVTGNVITDPWSDALDWAYGIFVHVDYNTGTISDNTFRRGARQARSVMTETVVVSGRPHNSVVVD